MVHLGRSSVSPKSSGRGNMVPPAFPCRRMLLRNVRRYCMPGAAAADSARQYPAGADPGCSGAQVSFGWRDNDDPRHLKTLSRHCVDIVQTRRFMQVRPRMKAGSLKAVAVRPLGAASITRPGDPFPESDVCKNCPQILFREVRYPRQSRGLEECEPLKAV